MGPGLRRRCCCYIQALSPSAHTSSRWTPGLRACSPLVEARGEAPAGWARACSWGLGGQQWQPLRLLPVLVHCSLAAMEPLACSWPWSEGHIPAPNPRLPVVTGPSPGGLDEGAFQASQRGKGHAPPLPTEFRVELGISDPGRGGGCQDCGPAEAVGPPWGRGSPCRPGHPVSAES